MSEKQVRRAPCKRCPIYRDGPDPECEDVKGFVSRGLMTVDEAVYICAWTKNRKCKGASDFYRAEAP